MRRQKPPDHSGPAAIRKEGASMRVLCMLFSLTAICIVAPVFAEEEAPPIVEETQSAELPTETVKPEESLGLGGIGYGSPVQSDRITPGEVFDGRIGYVHPFLSVGGFHTDNLFRTPDNEKADWVAVITPGIWFSLPASHQKLLEINLLNTAPGGLDVSRFRTGTERRFQGYALYRADIREHDRFTEENRVDQHAEGLFKISLRGGLSLELLDVYEVNHDPYGTGGDTGRQLDKYSANLFNAILAYQIAPKLMIRVDYGNYTLDYSADRNSYRNRSDNTYSGYVIYQATPKTAVFVQGLYVTIDYDDNADDDNEAMNYFLGIEMKATAKTRGLFKLGYSDKKYDHDSSFDRDDFLFEGQFDYAFTPKTSIYFRGTQRVLETDQSGARSILSRRAQCGYRQRITEKLRTEAAIFYMRSKYDGDVTIGTETGKRKDNEYGAVFALGYSPARWGTITLGYEYRERNSNFDTEEYRENTVFARLTVAM
jgi:hypothetical protein